MQDLRPKLGRVALVGAGPGAADLITVRGLRLLQQADVICYDRLVGTELLGEARADAELIEVGKRGYCVGSTSQESIHELLVSLARSGKTVVRLKGGDPCVFGRGGEEAEALAAHGIPFEIVPGITTALGACAAAMIPLTHRQSGQVVALVTGHHDPDGTECTHDWRALASLSTVAFYMASRYIDRIASKLIDGGMAAETAVAIIENATRPEQRIIDGQLSDIGLIAAQEAVRSPAILIVGDCVKYRHSLLAMISESILPRM